MEYRILGPLEVRHGDQPVPVGARRERTLLARLLLSANRAVSREQLIEDLGGSTGASGGTQALWVCVSRLRKALREHGGDDVLLSVPPGYVLRVEPEGLDAGRFEALVARARQLTTAGDRDRARAALGEALGLWRGPALSDLDETPFVRAEAGRLEEARLAALEERVELDLAGGDHAGLAGELEALTRAHPFRERFWSQRMLALYRAGRQAEALRACRDLRHLLAEELGIIPSEAVLRLETAILRHAPELDTGPQAGPDAGRLATSAATAISTAGGDGRNGLPLPAFLEREELFPFVGRAAEMAALEAAWESAGSGRCRLVLVAGEPGIGKTRLAAEIARQVHAEGATVLFGRCAEGLAVPYQPFVEALGAYVRHAPAPALGRLAGELVRLVPDIPDELRGLSPPRRADDPETERYRLFEAVTAWLSAASAEHPVLFVIDDLHWATRPTLLLLAHIVASGEPQRLLVVASYRDLALDVTDDLADAVAGLIRQPGVERLSLRGLDQAGVSAFLQAQARHELDDNGRALAETLHAETGGNLFFVGQVLRHLLETGALVRHEGRFEAARPLSEVGLPDGVRDVITRRLARLPVETRDVLETAAVLGDHFTTDSLVRAVGEAEISTLRSLDAAIEAHLVEAAGPGEHRFVHALVRATLYEGLPGARRVELHLRVGEAVEGARPAPQGVDLPVLAHHFARAGAAGRHRALAYAVRAGARAADRLTHDEAASWYRQALDLLDTVGAPDEARRCELLIRLGEAQRRAGDVGYRPALLDAARLAQRLGDPARLAEAALANNRGFFSRSQHVDVERVAVLEAALNAHGAAASPLRARLLVNLAAELVFSEEHERRYGLAQEAIAMARGLRDAATLGHVLAMGYLPALLCGPPDDLRRGTAELASVAQSLGDPALEFWSSFSCATTALVTGDRPELDAQLERAECLGHDLGQPFMRWAAALLRSNLNRVSGRLDEAENVAAQARELAEAISVPDASRIFHTQLFWIRYDQGRLGELVERASQAAGRPGASPLTRAAYCLALCELNRLDEAGPLFEVLAAEGCVEPPLRFGWLYGTAILAEVCVRLGSREHARTLFERLAPHHDLVGSIIHGAIGPTSHYLGLLATTLGRYGEAEQYFQEAGVVSEALGAPAWLARTWLEWARMLTARSNSGDEDQARRLVARSLAVAEDFGLAHAGEIDHALGSPASPKLPTSTSSGDGCASAPGLAL